MTISEQGPSQQTRNGTGGWIDFAIRVALIVLFGALACFGYVLKTRYGDTFHEIAGMALSVAGTGGLAVMAGIGIGQKLANERFQNDLAIVHKNMLIALANMRASIERVNKQEDAPNGLALEISHNLNSLGGCYSSIVDMSGSGMASSTIADTESGIDDLRRKLAGIGSTAQRLEDQMLMTGSAASEFAGVDEIKALVSEMLTRSEAKQISPGQARGRTSESAECPVCGQEVIFDIGVEIGDSAKPHCQNCQTSFHAHRGTDGIFPVLPGGAKKIARHVHKITCPDQSCGSQINVILGPDENAQTERICVDCAERIAVDTVHGTCTSNGKAPSIDGRLDDQGNLSCPQCVKRVDLGPFTRGGKVVGICFEAGHRVCVDRRV